MNVGCLTGVLPRGNYPLFSSKHLRIMLRQMGQQLTTPPQEMLPGCVLSNIEQQTDLFITLPLIYQQDDIALYIGTCERKRAQQACDIGLTVYLMIRTRKPIRALHLGGNFFIQLLQRSSAGLLG